MLGDDVARSRAPRQRLARLRGLCRDGVGGYQPAGGCVRFTDFIIADGEGFERDVPSAPLTSRIARFASATVPSSSTPIDREGRTGSPVFASVLRSRIAPRSAVLTTWPRSIVAPSAVTTTPEARQVPGQALCLTWIRTFRGALGSRRHSRWCRTGHASRERRPSLNRQVRGHRVEGEDSTPASGVPSSEVLVRMTVPVVSR